MPLPRLDIFRFCQSRNLEYAEAGQHHHTHEGWVQLHCPFCAGGTSGFHLGFSLEGGNFNCWRCGGHSAWDVVKSILNTTNGSEIYSAFVANASEEDRAAQRTRAVRLGTLCPPPDMAPLHKKHILYLQKRRYDVERLVNEWALTGTQHLSGDWSWRVVAPVHDRGGQIVAFVGRSVRPNFKPKYKVSEREECLVDPKTLLYGIDKVPGDSVVIVEGPSGVWRLGPGSVATLGIDWKRPQGNRLRKFKKRYILFDPEPLAQKRARELAEYLSTFPGETEIITGFKTDPGDLSDKRAARLMQELIYERL